MPAIDEALVERATLQWALVLLDRTRSAAGVNAARIAELRKHMDDGCWSILEHFDWEGHRYIVMSRTAARFESRVHLSSRERQVLALADRGFSDKRIGYNLDLSTSTISTYLARARRKRRAGGALQGRCPR